MFNKKEINKIKYTLNDVGDEISELKDFMNYYINNEIKRVIEEYWIEIEDKGIPSLYYNNIYTLNWIEVYEWTIVDIYDLKNFIDKIKEVKYIQDNTIKNLNKKQWELQSVVHLEPEKQH